MSYAQETPNSQFGDNQDRIPNDSDGKENSLEERRIEKKNKWWSDWCHSSCQLPSNSESLCLQCKARPSKFSFCSTPCLQSAFGTAGTVVEIPTSHVRFADIRSYFERTWTVKPRAFIVRIYKIVYPESMYQPYLDYRASVESQKRFRLRCRRSGNEVWNWHGTLRRCTLGDCSNTTLCTSDACSLCGIISSSYSMAKAKAGTYGTGIYTSPSSSTSNIYTRSLHFSTTRCLLLNRVVAGASTKKYVYPHPERYHSLQVNVKNYDQLVVHKNEAIRPAYLVVYTTYKPI